MPPSRPAPSDTIATNKTRPWHTIIEHGCGTISCTHISTSGSPLIRLTVTPLGLSRPSMRTFLVGRSPRERMHRRGNSSHLDDFGIGGEPFVTSLGESGEYGVGDVTHPGLKREQVPAQPAPFDLMAEEVQQVVCDIPGGFIGGGERGISVRCVGGNDGDDFGGIHVQIRFADAFIRCRQRYGLPLRGAGPCRSRCRACLRVRLAERH
jgi:hypothetical protein